MEKEDIFIEEDIDPIADNIVQKWYNIQESLPKSVWKWNILGTIPGFTIELSHVSWFHRLMCRLLFGSTWERINNIKKERDNK